MTSALVVPPVVEFAGWHRDAEPAPLPRILVTGSRRWTDKHIVEEALDRALAKYGRFLLVDGKCPTGLDEMAHNWAAAVGMPNERWPAAWDHCVQSCPKTSHRKTKRDGDIYHPGRLGDYCPHAGPRRNRLMVRRGAAACLAAPIGDRGGTQTCMRIAEQARIPVVLFAEAAKW